MPLAGRVSSFRTLPNIRKRAHHNLRLTSLIVTMGPSMPTEYVVTSPASSGLAAFKAHYATVEAALRVANMVIDEGASPVWIVDEQGNTILREDQIRRLGGLIAKNYQEQDFLLGQLQQSQNAVDRGDGNHNGE